MYVLIYSVQVAPDLSALNSSPARTCFADPSNFDLSEIYCIRLVNIMPYFLYEKKLWFPRNERVNSTFFPSTSFEVDSKYVSISSLPSFFD